MNAHLIDGEERPSEKGETFTTVDPATDEVLDTVALGGQAEVNAAVDAATRAGHTWRHVPAAERAALLRRLADLIRADASEIATLEARDSGRPISDCRDDVAVCADLLDYYATLPQNIRGATYAEQPGHLTHSRREPYGVVAAIAPWNFPFFFAVTKTAPALATGNTVVLKMAEQSPLTSILYGKLCLRAGFPPGVVNILNGDAGTGALLAAHPGVKKITFTGSTAIGRSIRQASTASCHLELGGKTANIVTKHADLQSAARASVHHAFFNAGQVCTAGSRLLLDEQIAEQFMELFLRATAGIAVGDPLDPATQVGALISQQHRAEVQEHLSRAVDEGASIIAGGNPSAVGAFLEPTVLEGVTPAMAAAQEEIFGPVVSVMRYRDLDEAVRIANGTPYGLAATVWTHRLDVALDLTDRLDAGIVWTNCPYRDHAHVPYEGHGLSGQGEEGGLETITEFTQLKVAYLGSPSTPWTLP
ncbi:aldehyde dehydrogenase family protein [Nonomuraea dietziae]|uniref:Acyl-CoA reductase-like NAD-dependent aldehyde dehydrogenase n=1 Tax=Nonomuraea dietziae TaxID=65515 RepID=A0A7W5VM68_9ACTN|nr:aldehyde dehydrogenase family protein [Nonomuraea dietziae]MBB3733960.1 acyl-CoA reductase-like NAD-dependent aldehyde dehydrogenase [Nonomuraea dietziae]